MSNIKETISATSQKAMINPDIRGSKHTNTISIRAFTMANMLNIAHHHSCLTRFTIMNADSMHNDMANTLYSNARSIPNLHFSPSPINGLVAIHNELILELDNHVLRKNYPEWLC